MNTPMPLRWQVIRTRDGHTTLEAAFDDSHAAHRFVDREEDLGLLWGSLEVREDPEWVRVELESAAARRFVEREGTDVLVWDGS